MSVHSTLVTICAYLRNEKPTTRNKAAEQLDKLLKESKNEIIENLRCKESSNEFFSMELLNSVIEAIILHSSKIHENRDAKAQQLLLNKNWVYKGIITNLIDFHVEDEKTLFPKSALLKVFTEGIGNRFSLMYFGTLFLDILDRGILKIKKFAQELKLNEYKRILSCLFEVNADFNDDLRFAILDTVNQTVETALLYVQISAELIKFLPEIWLYALKANSEQRRIDVLKLLRLFLSESSINFHHTICKALQGHISIIIEYYRYPMKNATKENFFHVLYLALRALYPCSINACELPIVPKTETWPSVLVDLQTICDKEVNLYKISVLTPKKELSDHWFIKFAACVTYLKMWPSDDRSKDNTITEVVRKKQKTSDNLEYLLGMVTPGNCNQLEVVWLAIFAEVVCSYKNVLNASNIWQVLKTSIRNLQSTSSVQHLQYFRRYLIVLLEVEYDLVMSKRLSLKLCCDLWKEVFQILKPNFDTNINMLTEQQRLIRGLIQYGKLASEDCLSLLESLINNAKVKCNEYIETVHLILKHAESIGIDKNSKLFERVINWLHTSDDKAAMRHILDIQFQINENLIAATSALAVVCFTNGHLPSDLSNGLHEKLESDCEYILFAYKKIRMFVCLNGKSTFRSYNFNKISSEKTCLLQNNYNVLMRILNFEPSKEFSCRSSINDLISLQKIALAMVSLIKYGIFNTQNLGKCPLIKRIKLFLNKLTLQLKSQRYENFNDFSEILFRLETLFDIYMTCPLLVDYLDSQSLKDVISFVGYYLHLSASRRLHCEFEDWDKISNTSFRILSRLCDSSTNFPLAFEHIKSCDVKLPNDIDALLNMIEVFSEQRIHHVEIGDWFVGHLKLMLKLYHTDTVFIKRFLKLIPGIFGYIIESESLIQVMFVALASLLKIAYKKSYSVEVTCSIFQALECVSEKFFKLHITSEFSNICLMVVEFLMSADIRIQFAAVRAITTFININSVQYRGTENYAKLCEDIFSQIKLKDSEVATVELRENAVSAMVQMLVSFFVCSMYHKGSALIALVHLCALHKLKEADLYNFYQVASYHNCSLSVLCEPYMESVIHTWVSNQNSIFEFPYFLCSASKESFLAKNLPEICTCMFLYGDASELESVNIYITKELWKIVTSKLAAFLLPQNYECAESKGNEYKQRMQKLRGNTKDLKCNILKTTWNWETVYYIISHMEDKGHFEKVFKYSMPSNSSHWFNLSFESIKRCLNCYANKNDVAHLKDVIFSSPIHILRTLQEMQKFCVDCLFPWERINFFHMYSSMMDIILDSIFQISEKSNMTTSCSSFFVRDAIFFVLRFTRGGFHLDVKICGMNYLSSIIHKTDLLDAFEMVVKPYLNDIFQNLIAISEESESVEIENLVTELINHLLVENEKRFKSVVLLLDDIPEKPCYNNLRRYLTDKTCNASAEASTVLRSFLISGHCGVSGVNMVREYVRKNKQNLKNDGGLLYNLIIKLITTVRNTSENLDLRTGCAKCLGDIGSIKISNSAYYFYSENSFYENVSSARVPVQFFHNTIADLIDKMLINFDTNIYQNVLLVAVKLSNSVQRTPLFEKKGYIEIFAVNHHSENCLEMPPNCSAINWINNLKATALITDFKSWICYFVSMIYNNLNWIPFEKISSKDANFAEVSLTPLINLLICDKENHSKNIFEMLDFFFNKFVECCFKEIDSKNIFTEKRILRIFLNICECIRTTAHWPLTINLLNVVEACNYCHAYFMSILYLELYYLQQKSKDGTTEGQLIANKTFRNLAIKAYESIGCNDALISFLDPLSARLHYLSITNNWYDILLENQSIVSNGNEIFSTTVKRNGIISLFGMNGKSNEIDYEVCWRLRQWDISIDSHCKKFLSHNMEQEFQKQHFTAIKSLFIQEENNAVAALTTARQSVISIMKDNSIECLQSVYKYLTWLQLLQQVEDFCQVQFYCGADLNELFGKWKVESNLDYGNFQQKEEILSHQITLFHTAGVRAHRKVLEVYKVAPIEISLLNCVKACVNAGENNLAKKNVAILRNMKISNALVKINLLVEDAEISFRTGKTDICKSLLEYVLQSNEIRSIYTIKAMILFGEYLMETNSETFEHVLKKTFSLALSFLDDVSQNKPKILAEHPDFLNDEKLKEFELENRKNANIAVAKYADREYKQLNAYLQSEEFQMKRKIIEINRETAETVSIRNRDKEKLVGATMLKKTANLDEREINSFESKCFRSLFIAMEHYIEYCKVDETPSESTIYRIIALWFSNKNNLDFYAKVQDKIIQIPSYKFLCVLTQITGRLGSASGAFLNALKELLIKCAQDHPQQTLYKTFPLVFALYDGTGSKIDKRAEIAKEIITKARTEETTDCINQMEKMFPALIELANTEILPGSKMKSTPLNESVKNLQNLNAVQCPTVYLAHSVNSVYHITSIVKWHRTVTLVGGINAPKKLKCQCSDGIIRSQLLKGKDDLRQDAVMQQVFSVINNIFKNDNRSSKRNLLIRTYIVVPLSMRSGILEWCENTSPLGLYLGEAHAKYNPSDYTVAKCRNVSMEHLKSDIQKRMDVFQRICQNIHPVMHFFLLEKFLVPGIWFERRLGYIKSVATNSMVGFILGIGDRHTQNILIDEETAELIHIDFGIAFEQGKIMPTPETVPFRLTRDMVAPMGICKTDGIFKAACETVMDILRRHRSIIITILEVLLYDPLYMWKILQVSHKKTDETIQKEETNLTAHRSLLCVQNKLEGRQAGVLIASDVCFQVQRLINEAVSPYNLCQLYPGWDPYL